jgi:Holliday junction resolvase
MPTTPEKRVKDKITHALKRLGVYYFYPVTGGYGHSGVPDLVCCIGGRFLGIEVKAGSKVPTALQQQQLDKIAAAGGHAWLVNEDTLEDFLLWLEQTARKET